MAQILVVDRLPNYLGRYGPYHPVIDEARDNKHLRNFREWVVGVAPETDVREVDEMKAEVQAGIQKSQDRLFLKYLDPKTYYVSIGKTVIGGLVDLAASPASMLTSIVGDLRQKRESSQLRWQGFLVAFGAAARKDTN